MGVLWKAVALIEASEVLNRWRIEGQKRTSFMWRGAQLEWIEERVTVENIQDKEPRHLEKNTSASIGSKPHVAGNVQKKKVEQWHE